VVKAARDAGATTLCVVMLPFKFEGSDQREQADRTLAHLRGLAHVLIVVPNDRLSALVGDRSVAETFDRVNDALASAIGGIVKLITQPGYLALDLANLEKAVQDTGGVGTLAYGEGAGPERVRKTVESLLTGPLVEGGRVIADARSLLVSIMGGPDLGLRDVGDIMKAIEAKARQDCHIAMGTAIDDTLHEKLSVIIVASEEEVAASGEAETPQVAEAVRMVEKTGRGRKKGQTRPEQGQLGLGPADRGRFKGVDPTLLDGEDLDIPTYLRRRLNVEK
jgi:cell division protein FtsZ